MNYRAKKAKQNRKRQILTSASLVVCLTATLFYLKTRLWVVDLSYEYNKLQKELTESKKENSRLRVEVQRLRSPARVDKIARTKLNLKTRDEVQVAVPVVVVEDGIDSSRRE